MQVFTTKTRFFTSAETRHLIRVERKHVKKWSLVRKHEKEKASEATDERWRSGHTEGD